MRLRWRKSESSLWNRSWMTSIRRWEKPRESQKGTIPITSQALAQAQRKKIRQLDPWKPEPVVQWLCRGVWKLQEGASILQISMLLIEKNTSRHIFKTSQPYPQLELTEANLGMLILKWSVQSMEQKELGEIRLFRQLRSLKREISLHKPSFVIDLIEPWST